MALERPVLLFVDDGHPEARDYDDNYLVVTPRQQPVPRPLADDGRWHWLRRLLAVWRPATA